MAKSVVLDCGHGGRDPGAIGKTTYEKNNSLTLGLKIGKILQNHNVTVHYTRTTDKDFCYPNVFNTDIDLKNRIAIAKQYDSANIFCSLHSNSFNKQAKGLEVFCFKTGGGDQKLAQRVYNQLSKLPFLKRGVKTANFYVLRHFNGTKTDACLVEYGFIDSEEDKILANMDNASVLIAKGLLEHLGIKYLEQNNGDDKVKYLVVVKNGIDEKAAFYLSWKYKSPIVFADSVSQEDIDNAETVFEVGGVKTIPKAILFSGSDRYSTAQKVLDYIRTN